ncbi:OmpA family protein [Marinobacter sp. CHS3-4]|uniref:OmpA family protein n=1 Tax=Marinobacter sp. CHS3-4 TaxID=3045174 RepID=UPI0024B56030|nr:OmpA family protein [Marinobacter sp. CHS3-4]MDI9244038.1 OmpA family protein [Marinobacter sp. CHS3-4]
MNVMRSLTLTALAATLAAPAVGDELRQTVYINPFIAYQLFDDQRDLKEDGITGAGVEYRFTPHWALEGVYASDSIGQKYVGGSSEYEDFHLDAIYYFAPQEETWNPYIALGAGTTDFGKGQRDLGTLGSAHDETRINAGGGFRYNMSEGISIRGDLRQFHGPEDSTFDTQVSLGLSFAFNRTVADRTPTSEPSQPSDSDKDGVPDNRDQCPGTPFGTNVNNAGCEPDSDNDGVADSRDQCTSTPAGASVNSRGCELDEDNDGVVNSKDQCPGTGAGETVDATGCTGETETVRTIELNVTFPTNSSVIGNRFDSEIQRVADFMRENPETSVEIAGHSDSRGDDDYNRFLSQRRADAVAARLTGPLGISADRVSSVGYGEAEPVASNDTAAGRAENRRVEARFQMAR